MYSHYSFKTPLEERPLFLNRFNPTLKVICTILLLVLVFIPVTAVAQICILILVISLWISAKLPFRKMKVIFKTLLVLFFFIFLINWLVAKAPGISFDLPNHYQLWGSTWESLFNKGWIHWQELEDRTYYYWTHGVIWGGWVEPVLRLDPAPSHMTIVVNGVKMYLNYSCPWYGLSSLVVVSSISMCIKLFCMLAIFSLLVNTTSTLQLTYAFEHVLWPLKWIKVPVTEISYIIAVAIRFVPTLFEEANEIIDAQASRGVDFRNGRLGTKIKAVGSLVVPMFAASFNHADKLSDAMEARNFAPRAGRTKYRLYHCRASHWVSFAILICLLALFIYLRVCKVIIYPFIAVDCFNI
ncbi:MAG: energy-coupling factor transporter transmembrane component T family protein [Mycoplasmoidaceae bacterium]